MKYLPELILMQIFKYLSRKKQFICASVCKRWRDVIISFMRICLWDELVLHIKPKKGKFKTPDQQQFHLDMCLKYSLLCNTLILYVCPCQNQNLINLVNMIKQKSLKSRSKLLVLIFRKEVPNKCSTYCRSLHESFHFTCQSFQDKLFIQNTRILQYLSFGYDCGSTILRSLSTIYGEGCLGLRSLNIANLSNVENEDHAISWLGQLHEVTINANLLTVSLLQNWLNAKPTFNLHLLRLLVFDSVVDDLLARRPIGEGIQNERSEGEHEADEDSTSKESDDLPDVHPIMSLEPTVFPKEMIWREVGAAFPFLKVHMVFVAENLFKNVLKINPSGIPLTHIVVILQVDRHDNNNCMLFEDWFSRRQQSRELESLTVHGVEPAQLRVFTSTEGEQWLDFAVNTVKGIREISLSGLFINVHNLIRGITNVPNLERLNIHGRDLCVDSIVQSSLQVQPTPRQVKKTEDAISDQMHGHWSINKSIPLQVVYKSKHVRFMDIARVLLQQHEDIQRTRI